MAWEVHKNTRGVKPKISIRGESQLGFNSAAIDDFKLKDYNYAVLYIDKELKKIGVRLTIDKEDEACKLKTGKGGAHISSKSFISKINKLGNLKSHQFNVQWDDGEKMIVAALEYN